MNVLFIKEQVKALIHQVPREPGTLLPQGATEHDFTEFSRSTGFSLPTELKEWLSVCNGPNIGPGGIFGIAPAPEWLTIHYRWELHPEWKEKGWFPIAGDGCGNIYVLDSYTGIQGQHPIYFLDHEVSMLYPDYIAASNLWHFLYFLLQRELDEEQKRPHVWPFNKSKVLAVDSALKSYQGRVRLPWEGL